MENEAVVHTVVYFILHHFLSISLDEQQAYACVMYKNGLHKTCMMYRIVYTKLSYSLPSQSGIIGYTAYTRSINMIYSARLFTLGSRSNPYP